MNELTIKDEAVKLHSEITVYAEQLQKSIYMIGKLMAEMKERELYKQLGYESFEEYTDKEFGMKKSQSAKFISVFQNLGKDYITEHQSLGISKLYLLSQLEPDEREEIETTAEDTSVRELKEEIEKLKAEKEKMQLTFFEMKEEKEKAEDKLSEADARIKELEDKPQDVAVSEPDPAEIDALVEEKTEHIRQKMSEMSEKLEEKEKEISSIKSQVAKVSKLETDKEMLEKKIEQMESSSSQEAENIKKAYEMKLENLQKKLEESEKAKSTQVEIPEGDDMVKFTAMMDPWLASLNNIVEFVSKSEMSEELKPLLKAGLKNIADKIK